MKHIRQGPAEFGRDYEGRGLAINSNDADNYPEDSPVKMAQEVRDVGYVFPYLYDETQEVAKAYGAACTPDFFLYDSERTLVYLGPAGLMANLPRRTACVTRSLMQRAGPSEIVFVDDVDH